MTTISDFIHDAIMQTVHTCVTKGYDLSEGSEFSEELNEIEENLTDEIRNAIAKITA